MGDPVGWSLFKRLDHIAIVDLFSAVGSSCKHFTNPFISGGNITVTKTLLTEGVSLATAITAFTWNVWFLYHRNCLNGPVSNAPLDCKVKVTWDLKIEPRTGSETESQIVFGIVSPPKVLDAATPTFYWVIYFTLNPITGNSMSFYVKSNASGLMTSSEVCVPSYIAGGSSTVIEVNNASLGFTNWNYRHDYTILIRWSKGTTNALAIILYIDNAYYCEIALWKSAGMVLDYGFTPLFGLYCGGTVATFDQTSTLYTFRAEVV